MTEVTPSSELSHHGVKGMKWGERKAKPTAVDIRAARFRQDTRLRQLHRFADEAETSTSPKQAKAAGTKAQKTAIDYQTNEDRVTAARLTRGEKIASVLLAGPAGLVLIGGNKIHVNRTAKTVDNLRKQVK